MQVGGDVAQLAEVGQPLVEKHDVSGVGGDRRGAPQRDRDVGPLEGDRIVDAVADEADLAALGLEFADVVRLVGGQDLGEVPVHPEMLGQSPRGCVMVSGDDRDVLDAAGPEPGDDLDDLGPNRRLEFDPAAQAVVDGDKNHRVAERMSVLDRGRHIGWDLDAFHLDVPAASNPHQAALEPHGDAEAHLELAVVDRRQVEPAVASLVEDRQGDRVVKLLLGGRGESQHGCGIPRPAGVDVSHFRPFPSQRPCLVEQHGVDLVHQIERPAVLDQDSAAGTQLQRTEHRQRGGHADAGAEVTVDDRDGARRPQRREAQAAQGQHRDHGLVGQPLTGMLAGEFVARRVGEDLADLGAGGFGTARLDGHEQLAGDEHGRGEDPLPGTLLGRCALPGQRVLVDHREPFGHDPVDRDHVAGVDDDHVAPGEGVERHLHLHAVLDHPHESGLLAEHVEQHLLRPVLRLLDQGPPQRQAPDEHGPGKDLSRGEAAEDDDHVQHVAAQPTLGQQQVFRPLERRDRRVEEQPGGGRQKGREGELRRGRQRERRGRQRQRQVELVGLDRYLRRREHAVEDFHQLRAVQLPGVVVDADGGEQGVGGVFVDAQDAHQLAFDRLGDLGPAVECRVGELHVAATLPVDPPGRNSPAEPSHPDASAAIAGDQRQLHLGRDLVIPAGPREQLRQTVHDRPPASPARRESQLGPRRPARMQPHVVDFGHRERAPQERAAGFTVGFRKDLALDLNEARVGERDTHIHWVTPAPCIGHEFRPRLRPRRGRQRRRWPS